MNGSSRVFFLSIPFLFILLACGEEITEQPKDVLFNVPRGYQARLEIQVDDQVLNFGPFVGYYFKPSRAKDISRLDFLCFNEDSFYARDIKPDVLLYSGTAVFQRLDKTIRSIPKTGERIVPLFFSRAPAQWKESRPQPQQNFIHFHSAYNAQGAVYSGFWLEHVAEKSFTYDMGGRVNPKSLLYHRVEPGPDLNFARIIEFDHGPMNR